jgi:hypothetical protein
MEPAAAPKHSIDRYQSALEAAGIGIWDNDLLTHDVCLAGYSHELFNIPKDMVFTVESWMRRIHPADRERTEQKLKQSHDPALRAPYENEYRIIDPETGEVLRWVRAKGKVYFNEEGTPCRFTGSWQDITREVRSRMSQQKLLALVDNSIELMSILEDDQHNSYLNKAGMEMLGFDSAEQVYMTPISELHTPEDTAYVQNSVLPSVASKGFWSGVMHVRHLKTGEVFPVYNNTVRIHDPVTGEPLAVGAVMRDMRPEMAAKRALEESEHNFRTLVMQAPVGICILRGPELIVELVNDCFPEVGSTSRMDLLGRKAEEIFPEATHPGLPGIAKRVFETGTPYYGKEVEVLRERDGQAFRTYVDFTFQPLWDMDRNITGIMDLSIDVTDKVLAKKQLLRNEEELQRRVAERTAELEKKNRELEEFNYITSHDLQEPIRKMKLFREMICERDFDKLSDFSKERFNKIGESLERMGTSLKDLLAYTSLNSEDIITEVDLNMILQAAESDLELVIEQKGAVICKSALPKINGVAFQMHQLFYNLLSNALKFSRAGASPVIEIESMPLAEERKKAYTELLADADYCEIIVRDNGIGFGQDKADKIFGMFQRLHSRQEYSGTGIGLSLCRKVVNNHGGHIHAVAALGAGAAFHILLPMAAAMPQQ